MLTSLLSTADLILSIFLEVFSWERRSLDFNESHEDYIAFLEAPELDVGIPHGQIGAPPMRNKAYSCADVNILENQNFALFI